MKSVPRVFSRRMAALLVAAVAIAAVAPVAEAEGPHDGRLFDPGVERTERAPGAPEALDLAAGARGDWEVTMEVHRPGGEVLTSTGRARITFMNRGHGFMERLRIADFDGQGHSLAAIGFLAVNAAGTWTLSEGDSWTESISIASGGFADDELVLHDARRPGGGANLVHLKRTYSDLGQDTFTRTLEVSTDGGATWEPRVVRRYQRRPAAVDFFPVRDDVGVAAPGRPAEAGEFDFLLGEFDAAHWLRLPVGPVQWNSNASAVHALDGYAILEFDWHDRDPSLPDAATTILRIYNRSMRRWESLFLTNRNHTPLHFGGVREGDRIVLHPFAAETASNPLSQWIFYDARPDTYRWKGITSADRGATWNLSWGIEFARKGGEPAASGAAEEVQTAAADGTVVFGDHYRPAAPGATTVLLFHQAGGDARGEYGAIAQRLVAEGFEVFAWDARSGGDRFGGVNRTVGSRGGNAAGYCEAYPDLEAALEHAFRYGSGGPIYAVGSSYSAALVIRLAAEHGHRLAGVAPFSPAGGRMGDCAVDTWLPQVAGVGIAPFRPDSEMANESVVSQAERFAAHGYELFVAEGGVHGASMLDASRAKGPTELAWTRFLTFLRDQPGD